MDSSALLPDNKPPQDKKPLEAVPHLQNMGLISRYNCVIDVYNASDCVVDGKMLQNLGQSKLYDISFVFLKNWLGKVIYFILGLVPIINVLQLFLTIYCFCIYSSRLRIHRQNAALVPDPFKNMTFYPQLCFQLQKDYYLLSLQFDDLNNFSLNYNKNMQKTMKLREQRGKMKTIIYNSAFWTSFHHFDKWKKQHIALTATLGVVSIAITVVFCIYAF